MDLFIALSLLIAIALIFLCVQPAKLANKIAFRKALTNLIIAIALHNPAADLLGLIPPGIVGLLCRIAGYIYILLSLRQLYLAFGAPVEDPAPPPANQL